MSRFFDLVQQAYIQPDDSSSPSAGPWEKAGGRVCLQDVIVDEIEMSSASRIAVQDDPGSLAADRFRFLRMRLRERAKAAGLQKLLITSPLPQDGKSTIALNLATALSERGERTVLLVEADLHRPSLVSQLGLKMRPGLAQCLQSGLDPLSVIRRLEPLGWYLLSAGQPQGNPTEILQGEALSGVLEIITPHFDWILIDSPPVLLLTDSLLLRRQSDASLLVARAGHTPREAIEKAVGLLGREHVFGVVLNGVDGLNRIYSGYYSGYYRQSAKSISEGAATQGKMTVLTPDIQTTYSKNGSR